MRAAYFETTGSPDVLRVGECPEPVVGPNDVLIAVRASSLDRLDIYGRERSHGVVRPLPHIAGRDIAGDIIEIGSEARAAYPDLHIGQAVVAIGTDAHAERARAPAELVFPIPGTCDYHSAAAIPTAGRSSYNALMHEAKIQAGEDVLIVAGSSGVGSFGIQIAKAAGCRVITTVGSKDKVAMAEALGARVINHYEDDVAQAVRAMTGGRGVDVVLEHVGTAMWKPVFSSMANFGRLVTIGVTSGHMADLHVGQLFTRGLRLIGVGVLDNYTLRKSMLGLLKLIEIGAVTPVVHAVIPLADIADAHRLMEGSSFFGKIVISME